MQTGTKLVLPTYGLLCTKFDLGWALPRTPAAEAYSAPQTPLAGLKFGSNLRVV